MADIIKLRFFIRFSTHFGQSIWVSGNIDELGNDNPDKAIPLSYLNYEFWHGTVPVNIKKLQPFRYKYFLKNIDNEVIREWGNDRVIEITGKKIQELQVVDTWNHPGEYENAFLTDPFKKILLKKPASGKKITELKKITHHFNVKAPLLGKHESLFIIGGCKELGEWTTQKPALLSKEGNWWTIKLNLKDNGLPIPYKYGVYDTKAGKFLRYENGNNRVLYSDAGKKKITVVHDGFVHLPNKTWKGAGVAIPVFSLRSKNSFGVGEFTDLALLIDWAKAAGLKMIQLLPVNDTTASGTWKDSYPYAAISAFALHPVYINLTKVAGKELTREIKLLKKKQKQLNDLPELDYETVFKVKLAALKELFMVLKKQSFSSEAYRQFFNANKHWLEPYAAYCFLRDKCGASDFSAWGSHADYNRSAIEDYIESDPAFIHEIEFWYFTQFHLHLQLKEASAYAHKKGIILKGDIPIGVSRTGCDAWVSPGIFNMEWQAGAPPDAFTIQGQNWGFPVYNWKKMEEDGFDWWKQRLEHLSTYFDAFRIDHILGFFRIWSIPLHAVQGIMGRFIPAIPVHISEFGEKGIWFDYHRYCKPYINDEILNSIFGELSEKVKEKFIIKNNFGGYDLLPGFETQRRVESYFAALMPSEENELLKQGLYELIANVILFEEENSGEAYFHFRISMEQTFSFIYLNPHLKEKLRSLQISYYYQRQDKLWAKEALRKLSLLKSSTEMLVCGEDLGMIPHCVPDVMKFLGILSLEIQRMPKDSQVEFFHPADAPYFSVVTPSTHDMSTIRAWWEESYDLTQRFYKQVLEQRGEAPLQCDTWICRAIVLQHLYSPAMWSIFQLQDILGMSEKLRREDPLKERINNPADPEHYWKYRMHIKLEDLIKEKEFNTELKDYIKHSGRS